MEGIGTPSNPLRVAVVGSGPAGFYACEELLRQQQPAVTVDLFDRLPTPYGLVRGGVAPDHQKIKSVIKLFERTAARPGFRFFGNVTLGKDLGVEMLLGHYHQVLLCTGAESDRRMEIPGEDLPGSFPATQFVGWYNGHPDYRRHSFDLSGTAAVVVGNGNVAMDVVRILARPLAELETTDIADYALEALRGSKIREIYLLGRRGPAQAAFSNPEIRELAAIEGVDLVVRPEDLELDDLNREFLENTKEPTHRRNLEILSAQAEKGEGTQSRKIRAWFFSSPVEVMGTSRAEGLRIERNELVKDEKGGLRARGTGKTQEIPCDLLFRSIGYLGTALPGVPFDERTGTIPNAAGRVRDPATGRPVPRVYVAGWIKRGPSGVIGTNKADAVATVRAMLEDAGGLEQAVTPEIEQVLRAKGVRWVSFADWERLDSLEVAKGQPSHRPRVKFTTVAEMLAALQ